MKRSRAFFPQKLNLHFEHIRTKAKQHHQGLSIRPLLTLTSCFTESSNVVRLHPNGWPRSIGRTAELPYRLNLFIRLFTHSLTLLSFTLSNIATNFIHVWKIRLHSSFLSSFPGMMWNPSSCCFSSPFCYDIVISFKFCIFYLFLCFFSSPISSGSVLLSSFHSNL